MIILLIFLEKILIKFFFFKNNFLSLESVKCFPLFNTFLLNHLKLIYNTTK